MPQTVRPLWLVLWEPSTGTSHRLPKPVTRKQLNRVTNNRNSTGNVTSRFYIGFALTQLPKYTYKTLQCFTASCAITIVGYPVELFPGYLDTVPLFVSRCFHDFRRLMLTLVRLDVCCCCFTYVIPLVRFLVPTFWKAMGLTTDGYETRFKNRFATVLQMLLCGECYENVYT
jgi:hypothetical protein